MADNVPACPGCKKPLDEKARCWKCNYRTCKGCGRNTTSVLIRFCDLCALTGKADEMEPEGWGPSPLLPESS